MSLLQSSKQNDGGNRRGGGYGAIQSHHHDEEGAEGGGNLSTIDEDEPLDSSCPRAGPFDPTRNQEIFKAVLYLIDAEKKKVARFLPTTNAMRWYYVRGKSKVWRFCITAAWLLYLLLSIIEGPPYQTSKGGIIAHDNSTTPAISSSTATSSTLTTTTSSMITTTSVHRYYRDHHRYIGPELACIVIFALDIGMQVLSMGMKQTWTDRWTQVFGLFLVLDFIAVLWAQQHLLFYIIGISHVYPILYYSRRARNAVLNYCKTLPAIMPWIGLELFCIILYSCIGVLLYAHIDRQGVSGQHAFDSFEHAFLSLYSLHLTVNNPDIYLPYYRLNFWNIIVFASFMIIIYFMLHNIILARIYDIYSNKLKDTAMERQQNRNRNLYQAFDLLDDDKNGVLVEGLMAHVLRRLRPHYSDKRIKKLMRKCSPERPTRSFNYEQFVELIDLLDHQPIPTLAHTEGHQPFPRRVIDALILIESIVVLVSIMNYWTMFYTLWFWILMTFFRVVFTLDLLNRVKVHYKTHRSTHFLEDIFNIFSVISFAHSLVTLVALLIGLQKDDWVLTVTPHTKSKKIASLAVLFGCCWDLFSIFERIPDYAALLQAFNHLLLPTYLGQAAMIFILLHIFCFIGMALFGGLVSPDQPIWNQEGNLYYLINFDSYLDGMVTLFMLMIVNNWNIISGNFALLTNSWAYLYFILFHVSAVVMGLNCVTSLFINFLSREVEEQLEYADIKRQTSVHRLDEFPRLAGGQLSSFLSEISQQQEDYLGGEPVLHSGRSSAVLGDKGQEEEEEEEEQHSPKFLRRKTSISLLLMDEEPVNLNQYRSILNAVMMMSISQDGSVQEERRSGYCMFINKPFKGPQMMEKSSFYLDIVNSYEKGQMKVFTIVKDNFVKESARREVNNSRPILRRDSSASLSSSMPFSPPIIIQDRLHRSGATLNVRLYILTDTGDLMAFVHVKEESSDSTDDNNR